MHNVISLEDQRRRKLGLGKARRRRHAQSERGRDLYQTHEVATQALLDNERLPYCLWEGSCGPGRMVRVLRRAGHEVIATDLVDYHSPDQDAGNFDFLQQTDLPIPGVDAIVMNPPFSMAAFFAQKAIELCPLVYLLLPLTFLEAGQEKTAAGRARLRVLDSGYLARVRVFTARLPMMHRDGWTGPKSTSTVAYAWFVFSWSHFGPALVDRISWRWESWMPPIER